MPRLFLAAEVTEEVRERIEGVLRDDLQPLARRLGWRVVWTRPRQLHVTLKFIGQVGEEAVPGLRSAMELALGAYGGGGTSLEIDLSELRSFRSRDGGTLHLPVRDPGGRLLPLVECLEAAGERAGVARETRAFRPHLTLGRVRNARPAREHLEGAVRPAALRWAVDEVVLFESRTLPDGAVYTELARWAVTRPGARTESPSAAP